MALCALRNDDDDDDDDDHGCTRASTRSNQNIHIKINCDLSYYLYAKYTAGGEAPHVLSQIL